MTEVQSFLHRQVIYKVVFNLKSCNGMDFVGSFEVSRIETRTADMANFPGFFALYERVDRFFDRRTWVGPVDIYKWKTVHLEPSQTVVHAFCNFLGRTVRTNDGSRTGP